MSIKLSNINKYYEDIHALKNVNLDFKLGKVYGIIGRNGAGKTSLLKVISKQIEASTGRYEANNFTFSYSINNNIAFQGLKAKQIFKIAHQVYPNYNERYEKELTQQLNVQTNKYYQKLSSGMKNLVNLIISLSSNSDYLLLDEPYVGLDPINRDIIYRFLVDNYFNDKHTVIISSHIITEIEGYFENAIMIQDGEIIVNDDIDKIREKSIVISAPSEKVDMIASKVNVLDTESLGGRSNIYIYDDISKLNSSIENFEINHINLETLMIKMLSSKKRGSHE